jgi:mannose/fructose-specific phosphotransferase system component IIA
MRAFRIVVAAHGDLATGLVSAAQLICGQIDDLAAVSLEPTDSPESFGTRLAAAAPDPDAPVLLLTDLVGGTPHNVALALARRRPSAVLISGVNLAVLMEAAMTDEALGPALVDRLVETGRSALSDGASLVASRSS